jgi:hypothetical protein
VKSILNKLTRERFATLYDQLLACCRESGSRPQVIEIIAKEVFAKATVQHGFVEMYAEVCAKLHHDLKRDGAEGCFKRVLLEHCRRSFNLYLEPPPVNASLDYEEQYEETVKYKTRMVGNVRLIGHLLHKRMLSPKVIYHCAEELLTIGSPEALETLCALFETVGTAFDVLEKEWQGDGPKVDSPPSRSRTEQLFARLKILAEDSHQDTRVRCLISNLLEKRRNHWREWGTKGSSVRHSLK